MTEEARAAKNAYRRKWAAEHPDRIREYACRHWQKVADAQKETEVKNDEEKSLD